MVSLWCVGFHSIVAGLYVCVSFRLWVFVVTLVVACGIGAFVLFTSLAGLLFMV